jgi:hypothetical protein
LKASENLWPGKLHEACAGVCLVAPGRRRQEKDTKKDTRKETMGRIMTCKKRHCVVRKGNVVLWKSKRKQLLAHYCPRASELVLVVNGKDWPRGIPTSTTILAPQATGTAAEDASRYLG